MPLTKITLPAVYRDLAPCAGRLAIEHADLHARIHETFLALALSIEGEVAFFTKSLERIQDRLERWLDGEKLRKKPFGDGAFYRYRIRGVTTLWLITPDAIGAEDFIDEPSAAFVTDAHVFDRDVTQLVDRKDEKGRSKLRALYVAGQFAGPDHWFHRFCHDRHPPKRWARAPRLRRLDCDAIAKAFPDQKDRILPKDDPRYAWAMRLRNPLPKERVAPILVFARKRLKVRTDARPEDLTERQRGEMEAALGGEKWKAGTAVSVSVEFTAPQRYILAMRRWGRRKGFRKFLLLKPRRLGATVLSQAEAYYHCLRHPKSHVASVAQKKETIERLFATISTFIEKDPFPPAVKRKTEDLILFENGSRYSIGSGKADALFRGDTVQRFDGSEVVYWRRGANSIAQMEQLMAGVQESARHGEIFLESTARGVEWMCLKYREAKKGQNDWWPIFVPWFFDPANRIPAGAFNEEEILSTLAEDEKDLVTRFGLSPAQLAFRRAKKKEYGALFLQEFPEDDESCFISAGTMFFDPDKVSELTRTVVETGKRKAIGGNGYEIRWAEPLPGVKYCAGCDTSEGLPGSDPNGVAILRRDTLEQVAAIHGRFRTTELAEHAVRLCRLYNDALLGIEREYHGVAVLDRVEALGYGHSHTLGGSLYYHGSDGTSGSGKRGWKTDEQSRARLIEDLSHVVREGSMVIRDREFVGEMMTFCRQSNGRWEHDDGAHDDTIFQWGIALQMVKHEPLIPRIAWVQRGA